MPDIGIYDVSSYDDAYYADETHLNWELDCDFDRDGNYDESLTGRMIVTASAKWGMDEAWQEVATPGECVVILNNNDNNLSPDNPSATYLTKLVPGCLMRLRAMYNGISYTRYIGRFHHMSILPGQVSFQDAHRVTLHITDPINELIAGEYNPPLLTAVRVDQVLQRMFDDALVPWPYDARFWIFDVSRFDQTTRFFLNTLTSFETAQTTLAFAGDVAETGKQRGVQPYGYVSDNVAAEAGGRFWWDAPTALFKFHNRYHDPLNTVVAAVPASITAVDPDDIHYGDDIANVVTINWAGRAVGTPLSILGNADNVPFKLVGRQVTNLTLRYRDPVDQSARVGGKDVVTPVVGLDIIGNSASNGSGTDLSSQLGLNIVIGATSIAISIVNTNKSTDIWVTKVQVRGTPVSSYNGAAAVAQSAASIAAYNRRPRQPKQISAIDNAAFALGYANKLVAQFSMPFTRIGAITVTAVQSADLIQALTLGVGDRITVNDSFTGHGKDYVIVGVQFTAMAADEGLAVRWTLKPWRAEGLWIFNTSRFDIDTVFAL